MTASQQTVTAPAPPPGSVEPPRVRAPWNRARAIGVPRLRHLALAAVLLLSAVLDVYRLSQNGYANVFYSAGVSSMLRSLHNFVFVSFDPGGLISLDKPPLGLWVQALSAKLFGFAPLSLLLPEVLAGVLTVALLYRLLVVRFGAFAAIAGALALAVFPSFVAVSRDNGVDPVLILLMLLACGAGLRAIETGRWLPLLLSALLVALAFNTKTLAAYLVVPGIALGYLVCAPASVPRRVLRLLAAGLLMLVVSFSWIAFVELTPASQRPYVGSSTNNTELGLTFEYNGFGRVEGQVGGPGRVPHRSGAIAHSLPGPEARPVAANHVAAHHISSEPKIHPPAAARRPPAHPLPPTHPSGRARFPISFGGPPGPLRLFGVGLGAQGGWMLPFSFVGLLAAAALLFQRRRGPGTARSSGDPRAGRGDGQDLRPIPDRPGPPGLRDPRLAGLLVFGGWFLVEAALLSLSKGIVHPYYMSALAPGAAAMAGVGAGAFVTLAKRTPRDWLLILAPCAVATTVAVQLILMHRENYLLWFAPVLICGAAVGVAGLVSRRLAPGAMALTFCLLLVAPTAYATTTWLAPVEGTFPAAGPTEASGAGGVGVGGGDLRRDRALVHYGETHRPGSRWALFTDAAPTAAPFILLGLNAGALTGYSGTDPALDGPGLARLVARGEARYVVFGGEFSSRGGNAATRAVLLACRELPGPLWAGPHASSNGLELFDCAGRERELAAS
jgi:4-amino-4-deoxy-L-arabinose transferase-like glycosyltransferase